MTLPYVYLITSNDCCLVVTECFSIECVNEREEDQIRGSYKIISGNGAILK